jgi:predicted CopG family antitoxin
MPKRTTLTLDDDVYEMLVREAVRRYGSTRALSRVANELLRKALKGLGAAEELVELLYAKRYARITVEEFERFRRELSRRLEER